LAYCRADMREASAFSPGHLTGFFQICDEPDDPLLRGSRGAGFSITLGVHTRVEAEPAGRNSVSVTMNGKVTREAVVSEDVARRMLSIPDIPHRVRVEHEVQIPIGAGFGSSGGGALSLALALNEALGLGMSHIEAARVAHVAEIECRTGLGTVLAELTGGFGVTVRPGAPGIGETVKFGHGELFAVCLPFGPIPTREALADPELRRRINELGGGFVDLLHGDRRQERFMELSRRFSEHVGLITPRLRAVLERTDEAGFPCTMAMFGEALFSLIESDRVERLVEVLHAAAPGREVLVAGIDDRGARLT